MVSYGFLTALTVAVASRTTQDASAAKINTFSDLETHYASHFLAAFCCVSLAAPTASREHTVHHILASVAAAAAPTAAVGYQHTALQILPAAVHLLQQAAAELQDKTQHGPWAETFQWLCTLYS